MAEPTAPRGHTPPYVSYPSFKTLMSDLHEHGLPSRIDRSVLKRFSGVVGTQLGTALRFLALVDDQNTPTPRLAELVAAYGTPEWGQKLIPVLQAEYAPLFGLDLGNATASHFNETFRKAFPGSEAVSQKSATFFLGAAKDAGIMISDRVLHGRKPRATNGAAARQRRAKKEPSPGATATQDKDAEKTKDKDSQNNMPWLNQLLAKFPPFDPEWDAAVQAKWFESFEKLMALLK